MAEEASSTGTNSTGTTGSGDAAAGTTSATGAGGATSTGTGTSTGRSDEDANLGDAGVRAIREERDARRRAEKEATEARAELEKIRTATQSDQEKALQKAKDDGKAEALSTVNERILKAEIKALAGSKLTDPMDAVRFLDLSDFKVDSDGNVDEKAIKKSLDELVKERPYLAKAGSSGNGRGSADGGARGGAAAGTSMNDLIRSRMSR